MTTQALWRLQANGVGEDRKRVVYDELHQGDDELDAALAALEAHPETYTRPRVSPA